VAAGPHRDLQLVLARKRERRDHIIGGGAASHEPRTTRDHGVEQRARIDVLRIARSMEAPMKAQAQLAHCGFRRVEDGGGDRHRSLLAFDHGAKLRPAPAPAFARFGHSAKMAEIGYGAIAGT
jgi:hypothetical protein